MVRKTLNNNRRTAELPDTHLYETTILSLATFQEKRKGQTSAAAGLKRRRTQNTSACGPDLETVCERNRQTNKIECQLCKKFINKENIQKHQLIVHWNVKGEGSVPPPHVEKVLRWLTSSLSPPSAHQLRVNLPPSALLFPTMESDSASAADVAAENTNTTRTSSSRSSSRLPPTPPLSQTQTPPLPPPPAHQLKIILPP